MRKILVIFIILSSMALAQNDGLVKTNYPSGALQTEGNYANGVRDGLWTFWYEGEVYQDYGEDDEPNTQDEGENNGVWDSTETVILDIDGDTFYDPPQKKMEGSYFNVNFDYAITVDKRNQPFQPTSGHRTKFQQSLPLVVDITSISEVDSNISAVLTSFPNISNMYSN